MQCTIKGKNKYYCDQDGETPGCLVLFLNWRSYKLRMCMWVLCHCATTAICEYHFFKVGLRGHPLFEF